MTSSPHGPYGQGYTHATMGWTMRCWAVMTWRIAKPFPSADRGLQLAPVKSELLVTVYQQWHGEYVPGSCTHRPSRHGSWERLKSVC